MNVLDIEDLRVRIGTPHGLVEPVRGVSLSIAEGEAVAIVGESGSGKTVTAMSILRLMPSARTRIEASRLDVCGRDVLRLDAAQLRELRGRRVAMVFQDPMHSLNPVMRIGAQIAEAVKRAGPARRIDVARRVEELLDSVEVDPARTVRAYPHQLSGGMKQRVMIAMALACRPDLIIADEPTTALDVSTQAAVLRLLERLSRESGTSLLFVTHDLGVVAMIAERVAVMYAGRVVETGTAAQLFEQPRHPYTCGLLKSVPRMTDVRGTEFAAISGSAPDVRHIPSGCPFGPRCHHRTPQCVELPRLEEDPRGGGAGTVIGTVPHLFACWNPSE